jgi:hypothetical protein
MLVAVGGFAALFGGLVLLVLPKRWQRIVGGSGLAAAGAGGAVASALWGVPGL